MTSAQSLLTPARGAARHRVCFNTYVPRFDEFGFATGVRRARVGFPGRWKVEFAPGVRERYQIGRGQILRALRNFAFTAQKLGLLEQYDFGEVYVHTTTPTIEIPKDQAGVTFDLGLTYRPDWGKNRAVFAISPSLFNASTSDQVMMTQQVLGSFDHAIPFRANEAPDPSNISSPTEMPRVMFLGFSSAVERGEAVLINAMRKVVGRENAMLGRCNILEPTRYGTGSTIRLDREQILNYQPDWIVFSALAIDWGYLYDLGRTLPQQIPEALILGGGWGPTRTPERFAAYVDLLDIVIRGKGEYELPRLARILGKRKPTVITPYLEEALPTFAGSFMDFGDLVFVSDLDMMNTTTNEGFTMLSGRHELGSALYLQEGCSSIETLDRACGFCNQLKFPAYGATSEAVFSELLERQRALSTGKTLRVSFIGDDSLARPGLFHKLWNKVQGSPLEGKLDLRLTEASTRPLVLESGTATFDTDLIDVLFNLGLTYIHLCTDGFSDRALKQLTKRGHTFRDDLLVGDEIVRRGAKVARNLIVHNPYATAQDLTEVLLNYYFAVELGKRPILTLNAFAYPIEGTPLGSTFMRHNPGLMTRRNHGYRLLFGRDFDPAFISWVMYPIDQIFSTDIRFAKFLARGAHELFKDSEPEIDDELEDFAPYPSTIVNPLRFVIANFLHHLPAVVEASLRSNGVFRDAKLALLALELELPMRRRRLEPYMEGRTELLDALRRIEGKDPLAIIAEARV